MAETASTAARIVSGGWALRNHRGRSRAAVTWPNQRSTWLSQGGVGGGDGRVVARMAAEPGAHARMLVRRVVVDDEMYRRSIVGSWYFVDSVRNASIRAERRLPGYLRLGIHPVHW